MMNLRPLNLGLGSMIAGFNLNKFLVCSRFLGKRLFFLLTSIWVAGCVGHAPGPLSPSHWRCVPPRWPF